MPYIHYCPKCNYEEIKEKYPDRNKITFKNLRDGWGRPITHFKCDCGNYLAGCMSITDTDDEFSQYAKEVICCYNEGGDFYVEGLHEGIKKNMKRKIKEIISIELKEKGEGGRVFFSHIFKKQKVK